MAFSFNKGLRAGAHKAWETRRAKKLAAGQPLKSPRKPKPKTGLSRAEVAKKAWVTRKANLEKNKAVAKLNTQIAKPKPAAKKTTKQKVLPKAEVARRLAARSAKAAIVPKKAAPSPVKPGGLVKRTDASRFRK